MGKALTLEEKVDRLADLHTALTVLELQKQEVLRKHLPPEALQMIEEIDAEFTDRKGQVEAEIKELAEEVERGTIERGYSVTGQFGQMVYQPGRVTWDTKKLEGMATLIKGINEARRVGKPFAQFKRK